VVKVVSQFEHVSLLDCWHFGWPRSESILTCCVCEIFYVNFISVYGWLQF